MGVTSSYRLCTWLEKKIYQEFELKGIVLILLKLPCLRILRVWVIYFALRETFKDCGKCAAENKMIRYFSFQSKGKDTLTDRKPQLVLLGK